MAALTARQLAALHNVSREAASAWIRKAIASPGPDQYPVVQVTVPIGSGAKRKAWALDVPDAVCPSVSL